MPPSCETRSKLQSSGPFIKIDPHHRALNPLAPIAPISTENFYVRKAIKLLLVQHNQGRTEPAWAGPTEHTHKLPSTQNRCQKKPALVTAVNISRSPCPPLHIDWTPHQSPPKKLRNTIADHKLQHWNRASQQYGWRSQDLAYPCPTQTGKRSTPSIWIEIRELP